MNMKNKNCEDDCGNVCTGCDRTFCEIKEEDNLSHQEELPESQRANSGNYYCHPNCYESMWG